MGYAIPRTVIAVGFLITVTRLDQAIDNWMRAIFDACPELKNIVNAFYNLFDKIDSFANFNLVNFPAIS